MANPGHTVWRIVEVFVRRKPQENFVKILKSGSYQGKLKSENVLPVTVGHFQDFHSVKVSPDILVPLP